MRPDIEPAVRIAWAGAGYTQIKVVAPRRTRGDLDAFASGIADEALVNRDYASLRAALRRRFGGTFDIDARQPGSELGGGPAEPLVLVTLHPPKAEPNPDPPSFDEFA
ncbi:MAG TPA: hypothetical protein VGQ47_01135 [Candidatus Limnocylindrales bacterium]|jgi:hypothetical protein|nr:hypothetical protein [Candidatus Limnocylindrales bacterium]